MANIVIDGTIENATLKRAAMGQSIFEAVTVRRSDGTREHFRKLIVANALRDALKSGATGRFYFHKFIDQSGLHAVRSGSRSQFAFPRNIEIILGIMGTLNLLMLVGWIAADGGVRLLPAIFGPLCTALFIGLAAARHSAARQFTSDGAARASVQARSAPATSL